MNNFDHQSNPAQASARLLQRVKSHAGWWKAGTMKYSGILRIGFKLLVNDKAKFSALLIGITFAVFLMMQMTAMFAGILNRAYSTVTNIGAGMWIMDPAVNTASSAIPLPDYLLDACAAWTGSSTRCRSLSAARWSSSIAAPINR